MKLVSARHLALITALSGIGCAPPPSEPELAHDQINSALYSGLSPGVTSQGLWPGGVVPVCFANVDPNASYSKMLRNEIEGKWGRYGNVRFTGWGTCSANPGNVVRINNEARHLNPRS